MFERSTDKAAREAAVAAAALRLITRDGDAALTVRRVPPLRPRFRPPLCAISSPHEQDAVREVMMRAVAQRLQSGSTHFRWSRRARTGDVRSCWSCFR